MSKILMLYPDLPSETKAAGHKTSFKIIEELSKSGHEIRLLAFNSTGILHNDLVKLRKICTKVKIIDIDNKNKLVNCIKNVLVSPLIASRIAKEFIDEIDKDMTSIDYVHIEFSQMLFYVKYIKKRYPQMKILFNSHDIICQRAWREAWKYRLLNPYKDVEWLQTRWCENHFLEYTDTILVQSNKDADLLEKFRSKVRVISPYIPEMFTPLKASSNTQDRYIVFFGAMSRKENYAAVQEFIVKCWGSIHQTDPALHFYVIGGNPHSSILKYDGRYNIWVTGFLDDPYPVIGGAAAAIAPIRLGAGLKVKVLECLKSGCPVVSFPAGAEGIDLGREAGLIIVNTYQEMANEIRAVLTRELTFDRNLMLLQVNARFNWGITVNFLNNYYI